MEEALINDKENDSHTSLPQNETIINNGYDLSDIGNAKQFAKLNKDTVAYVGHKDFEGWRVFDGKKWDEEDRTLVDEKANDTSDQIVEQLRKDARVIADKGMQKEIKSHIKRTSSGAGVDAMKKLSRTYLNVSYEKFDTHPHLINVGNGVLDLKKDELIPHSHSAKYCITRYLPSRYDKTEECPRFKKFVAEAQLGDLDMIHYLQK